MSDIRRFREAAGIPRIILADRAKLSRMRLYEAEAGLRELTPQEKRKAVIVIAERLAEVAGVLNEFQRYRNEVLSK